MKVVMSAYLIVKNDPIMTKFDKLIVTLINSTDQNSIQFLKFIMADRRYNKKHRFGDTSDTADGSLFAKFCAWMQNCEKYHNLRSNMADDRHLGNRHIAIYQ